LDDDNFQDRELVALLLAKIYFYLNEYDEALSYALRAGKNFEINSQQQSDFTEILINKAI
jgi:26S proteasome regulatory subunit N2